MNLLLAVTSEAKVFWYVALGIGLVVVLVVVVLLSMLSSLVRDIDVGVAKLGSVIDGVGTNVTATVPLIASAAVLRELRDTTLGADALLADYNAGAATS